jgi:hypothetical protein
VKIGQLVKKLKGSVKEEHIDTHIHGMVITWAFKEEKLAKILTDLTYSQEEIPHQILRVVVEGRAVAVAVAVALVLQVIMALPQHLDEDLVIQAATATITRKPHLLDQITMGNIHQGHQ